MHRRLQVLLDERELKAIQRAARAQNLTTAEWVRQVLRAARREQPGGGSRRKLEAISSAARYSFPSGEIDSMLAEIDRGYSGPVSK